MGPAKHLDRAPRDLGVPGENRLFGNLESRRTPKQIVDQKVKRAILERRGRADRIGIERFVENGMAVIEGVEQPRRVRVSPEKRPVEPAGIIELLVATLGRGAGRQREEGGQPSEA